MWYQTIHGKKIPQNYFLPILQPLQGDLKTGNSWKIQIISELTKLSILPTTHKQCLYQGLHNDNKILLCCQINDFAAAVDKTLTTDDIFKRISSKIDMASQGILDLYNCIDIKQGRAYKNLRVF